MPHDVMPTESSPDETALDGFSELAGKRSSVLDQMKQAGRALVRAAKHVGTKGTLAAMMAAGTVLCAPHSAKAQSCGFYQDGIEYYVGGYCPSGPTLGSPGDRPGGYTGGDPVDIASGNVFLHVVDYTTAGQNPLQLIRYYNSNAELAAVNTLGSTLGLYTMTSPVGGTHGNPVPLNWRTNYDRFLQFNPASSPTEVVAERPDGQQITFNLVGSTWVPPTDLDYTLTQSGPTWTLKDHNDTVESYTYNAQGWAQLNTITTRNGYQQTITYNGTNSITFVDGLFFTGYPVTYNPGLIQSVTDSYGRSLDFTYAGGLLQSIATPDSLVISYGFTDYNGVGNLLTSVSYNTNPVTSQSYAYTIGGPFPTEITSVTDENGNTSASWAYDGAGQATESQQGDSTLGANTTFFTYNDTSTTVTNANGVADTYNFSTLQGIPKLTSISRAATSTTAAATESIGYDSNGYINTETDWNGNQTSLVNDSFGDPTSITEAAGTAVARTTTISYGAPSGACTTFVHLPCTIATQGVTRSFTYDGNGNPLSQTDTDTTTNTVPYSTSGQTRVTQLTWSGTGEMLSVQLPRTDATVKTSFGYDASGTLVKITDPLNHVTNITAHTGGGYPTTIVDPNGVTTTLTYDGRLNLNTSTLHTTAGNLTTTWTHDPANNLIAVQSPGGAKLSYTRDSANRLTGVTDLLGNSIAYTLDELGDRTATTITNAASTVTYSHAATFDALGRKLTDTSMGNTTNTSWDPNSNLLSITNPLSNTVNLAYDPLNRLATRADPAPGGTTTFTYDAHNRLTNVQDANGHNTSYVNDGFGDVTQVTSPDSGASVYTYDPDSNLTQRKLAGGQVTNFTYDAADRNLTASTPADHTLNIAKTYDQTTGHGSGIGRLTSVTDQAGTDSFTYDQRGHVTNEKRAITGVGNLNTATAFDADGDISGITYPSGTVVNYTRNVMDQVTTITAKPPGAHTPSNVATGISYEPFGPVSGLTFGNGITGTYGFDGTYRATSRVDATTAANVMNLAYTYYPNDSLNTITDAVNPGNSQSFGYDNLDRLTSAASGAGGYGSYAWTWDPVGNLETQTLNGTATVYSLAPGTNRLAKSVTGSTTTLVNTTTNGNITAFKQGSTVTTSFAYNQANQVASATGPLGATDSYKYGFGGQRLEKVPTTGYPILYQYGQAATALLAESDLHNGQVADYVYMEPSRNSAPVGEVNPGTGKLYFMHTDRQGTPQLLTDTNANVAWSAFYNPFGNTLSFTGLATQSLRLPGQTFDPETGLSHNGFRDYAGALTRYVQADPSGLNGGMNPYAYANANPFRFTDPTGLDPGNNCPDGGTSVVCTGNNGPDFVPGGNNCGLFGCFSAPDDTPDDTPDDNPTDNPINWSGPGIGGPGDGCGLFICPDFGPGDNGGGGGPAAGPQGWYYFAGGGTTGNEQVLLSDGGAISAVGGEVREAAGGELYGGVEYGGTGPTPVLIGDFGFGPEIGGLSGWSIGVGGYVTGSGQIGLFGYVQAEIPGYHQFLGGGYSWQFSTPKAGPQ